MSRILDKKEFVIKSFSRNAQYKLYLAKHSDGIFHAGVVYYDVSGSWEENTKQMTFHLESFVDFTEDQVLKEAKNWVLTNIDLQAVFEEVA